MILIPKNKIEDQSDQINLKGQHILWPMFKQITKFIAKVQTSSIENEKIVHVPHCKIYILKLSKLRWYE